MKGEGPRQARASASAAAGPAGALPAAPLGQSSDALFLIGLSTLLGSYIVLIAGLLCALGTFTTFSHILAAIHAEEIRFALRLSLISCSMSTLLSLWVAIPGGYVLSRFKFPGRSVVDAVIDIPIVLPPLVMGLALLILFQTPPGCAVERFVPVTFAAPAVVLAQFTVACAFAVRTMRVTFDQISPRAEQVALTLGCGRSRAFWMVALPEARRGVLTAATLAWRARSVNSARSSSSRGLRECAPRSCRRPSFSN